jgi:hypothetical protein
MLEENLAYNACRNVTALQFAVGMVSGAVEDNVFRIWGDGPERADIEQLTWWTTIISFFVAIPLTAAGLTSRVCA